METKKILNLKKNRKVLIFGYRLRQRIRNDFKYYKNRERISFEEFYKRRMEYLIINKLWD